MFVADTAAMARYAALGVTLFVIGSDQSLLRSGFSKLSQSVAEMRRLIQ